MIPPQPGVQEAKVSYEMRTVAFVDILGFSDLVARSIEEPVFLGKLHRALHVVGHQGRVWMSQVSTTTGGRPEETATSQAAQMDFRSQVFSDSIVLSQRGTFLVPLFISLAQLSMALLELGVLVRGGVAIGPLFHDASTVFGPALIEAYRLESRCAKVPRIVVSDHVFRASQEGIVFFPEQGDHAVYRPCEFLRRDSDRLYHLDCLVTALVSPPAVIGADETVFAARLNDLASLVRDEFQRETRDVDTRAKWGWFLDYFNDFARARVSHLPKLALPPIVLDDDEMDPAVIWRHLRRSAMKREEDE